jgi:hypothetical protein
LCHEANTTFRPSVVVDQRWPGSIRAANLAAISGRASSARSTVHQLGALPSSSSPQPWRPGNIRDATSERNFGAEQLGFYVYQRHILIGEIYRWYISLSSVHIYVYLTGRAFQRCISHGAVPSHGMCISWGGACASHGRVSFAGIPLKGLHLHRHASHRLSSHRPASS